MTNPTQLIEQLASLLKRYRTETQLGHQPYLIAETVDSVLCDARAHLEQPTEPAPSASSAIDKFKELMQASTPEELEAARSVFGDLLGLVPAPSTAGERADKIISLPIPASASDLKSDIVELIQSHKYKGLRSIEVLGVFQFLGAEIISGSNS
jgi:hypothetical protein